MVDESADLSIAALLGDVGAKTAALLKAELGLFGAEMREKTAVGAGALIWLAAGACVLATAFALGVAALVFLLISLGVKPHVAAAALALVMACIGALLLRNGLARMRRAGALPQRILAQWRDDATILKKRPHNA